MSLPPEVQELVEVHGYSAVPARGKQPLVAWGVWQDRLQTPEERDALPAGDTYGILTGGFYGLTVLDFDSDDALSRIETLNLHPNVLTSRGAHVWLFPPSWSVKTCAGVEPGVDVRGEGGLEYVWSKIPGKYRIVSLDLQSCAKLPGHLLPERRTYGALEGAALPTLVEWGYQHGSPEAMRVLRAQATKIRAASPGSSNTVTNGAAFTVGGLIGSGELDAQYAEIRLLEAASERGVGNCGAVIRAALLSGVESPWSAVPVYDGEEFETVSTGPRTAAIAVAQNEVPAIPGFPISAFPPDAAEYAKQTALASGSTVEYTASCLLPMFGAAIGSRGSLCVDGDQWVERAAVWVALVGDPGVNKSPALKLSMAPAREVHRNLIEFEGSELQLFLDDTTIEGAFFAFQKNDRGLLLYQDELIGWVNSMAQYKTGKGSDRQHWLKMWSGEDVTLNRAKGANKVRFIREPFLNAVGGIQPEVLEQLAADVQDGLGARLLLAPQGETVAKTLRRPKMDPAVTADMTERWHTVRDAWVQGARAEFTPDALETFSSWYEGPWASGLKTAVYPGVWAKMSAHAARIAFILSQLRKPGTLTVTREDVDGGIALVHYYYEAAVVLYSSTQAASGAERQYRIRLNAVRKFLDENPGAKRVNIIDRFEWAQGFMLDNMAGDLGRPDLRSPR